MAETVPDATGTVLQLWAALLACVVLRVCRWLAATCWVAALSLMLSAALIEGRRGAKGRGGEGLATPPLQLRQTLEKGEKLPEALDNGCFTVDI